MKEKNGEHEGWKTREREFGSVDWNLNPSEVRSVKSERLKRESDTSGCCFDPQITNQVFLTAATTETTSLTSLPGLP